ncbi:MAG: AraC family transcriptional regulator [Odoribacter sp.]|nr:AraC family transcriptional regulator [Odoribacter sp.]
MERQKLDLNSIDAYNRFYGLATRHPLAAVIDLKEAKQWPNHFTVEYGVYALYLKNNAACSIRYGRRNYDYQAGTVVSFSPGQTVDVDMAEAEVQPDVVGLLFHPDLIYGTPLADKIKDFSFFDYTEMESLHLSDEERRQFLFCLDQVKQEIKHPVDNHSSALISANIQLLIEYLHRFYDRQFITRHKVNSDVVANFERQLKAYITTPQNELPGVAFFAEKANLSPGYFSDLIRKETGSSPKDIITLHLIKEAKHRLTSVNSDISEIAYTLGFEYPAHFTRMFKRVTGLSPTEFRAKASQN